LVGDVLAALVKTQLPLQEVESMPLAHISLDVQPPERSSKQTGATTGVGGGCDVGWISNGNWIAFNNVGFHARGLTKLTTTVSSGITGLAQVAIGSPTAFPVAVFAISSTGTGGWQSWKTIWVNIMTVPGIHTMYMAFVSGQPKDFVNVNWVGYLLLLRTIACFGRR
jgi:hypothetical protein